MKKILIIEDDSSICTELKELLNNAGYEATSLTRFNDCEKQIFDVDPDLILLDINIPGLNGEILLKEIRKTSGVPVIMVTSKSSEVDEVLSMSYGADDYVTKPYNPTILLLRIGNVLKRMEHSLDSLKYESLVVNFQKGAIISGDEEITLTKNEMIIFSYLLNKRGKIVTRDELMTSLWNNDEYVNDNALTVNISRLRAKLSMAGYPDAIDTRKGQGYVLK